MVMAYDNARLRQTGWFFLPRVETSSEICEELKLTRRNAGKRVSIAYFSR
jgi:hypothetical protein